MGNQLACTLRHAGKTCSGKALLESTEILFRGDTRLKIPFSAITSVSAANGELHILTKDGLSVFGLGPQAPKWREKIANPKSVLDKLGVKPGQSVSLFGNFPADFLASLHQQGTTVTINKVAKDTLCVFFLANQKQQLRPLASLAKSIQGSTALWLLYPKGQTSITESDVRSAGLRTGLVDIKVVSFSPTHTALKFVVRKSYR